MASFSGRYILETKKESDIEEIVFDDLDIALDYIMTADLESLLIKNGQDLDRALLLSEPEGNA